MLCYLFIYVLTLSKQVCCCKFLASLDDLQKVVINAITALLIYHHSLFYVFHPPSSSCFQRSRSLCPLAPVEMSRYRAGS